MSSKTAQLKYLFNEVIASTLDEMPFLRERNLERHLRLSLDFYVSSFDADLKLANSAFSNDVKDWLDMAHRFQTSIKQTKKTPDIDWQSIYKIIIGMNYLEMGGFDDLEGGMKRPLITDIDFVSEHFTIKELNILNGYFNLIEEKAKSQEEKLELWGNSLMPMESRILLLSQDTLDAEELIAQSANVTFLPEDVAGKFGQYNMEVSEFYLSERMPEFTVIDHIIQQIECIFDIQPNLQNSNIVPLFK
jgi:hypothetical protein